MKHEDKAVDGCFTAEYFGRIKCLNSSLIYLYIYL